MVLTGSCTTFLPYRHGLGPRRRVPDCPSSPVTFRPRHLHNTGQRIASFGARLHGIRLAAYAQTTLPPGNLRGTICFFYRICADEFVNHL